MYKNTTKIAVLQKALILISILLLKCFKLITSEQKLMKQKFKGILVEIPLHYAR